MDQGTVPEMLISVNPLCIDSGNIIIFLDFHSTKQGLPLVDSWSRGVD